MKKLFELPDYQCTFDFPFVPASGQRHLKVIPGFVFWLCIVVFWKCYFNYLSNLLLWLTPLFNFCKVDIRGRSRSLPRNSLMTPSHIQSSPTVTSNHSQHLVSVQSEGSATMRKNLEVRKTTRNITPTQLQINHPRESCVVDDPSDESGAEDEIIVRIDSPSRLSFRRSSWKPTF